MCPRAHGVDQVSRVNHARIRGPMGSTRSARQLWPWSKGPRVRPAVPGNSCLGPRACGVDRLSQGNQARAQGPAGSCSCPGRLGPVSEGSWGRQALPGHSGPCLKAHGYHQFSRANRIHVRWPAGSTSSPRRFGPVHDGPRARQAVPGASRLGLWAREVDPKSLTTRPRSERPRFRPGLQGNSGRYPKPRVVIQMSRATPAQL